MFKIDTKTAPVFTSESGETIMELVGPGSNGSKGYSIAECTMTRDAKSEAHYHPIVEETYLITEGAGYMMINKERLDIKAGDTIVIPAKTTHQVINSTDSTLKFLVTCVPEWTPECSVFV